MRSFGRHVPELLLFLSLAIAAFLLSFHNITSSDVWTLLGAGRWMVENRQIPGVDVFSYTKDGMAWINSPWAFELLVYNVHLKFGMAGLVAMKAIWITGIFSFLCWSLGKQGVRFVVAVPLLYLGVWAARFRFLVRPQLVTMTLLPVFYFLLRRYTDGKLGLRQLACVLVPLEVLWANCHGGVVWSLFLVLAFLAGARRGQRRDLVVLLILLALAALINPFSWQTVIYGLFTGKEKFFTQYIIELWPAGFSLLYYPYWLCLGLGAASFLVARKVMLTDLLIFAVMAWISVTHRRFMGEFVVVCLSIMAMNLAAWKFSLPAPRAWHPYAAAVLVLATACMGMNMPGWGFKFGGGVEKKLCPAGAAGFIKANNLRGPLFNPMGFGGYLIWDLYPYEKVFMDGRTDVYGADFLYDEVKSSDPVVWKKLEQAYGFNLAIFSMLDPSQKTISTDPDFRARWALVWFSDAAFIYVRVVPQNKAVIAEHGYAMLRPEQADLSYLDRYVDSKDALPGVIAELERALAAQPDCVLARTSLAYIYDRTGEYGKAAEQLEQALRVIPYKGELSSRIGTAYLKAGQYGLAIAAYKKALALGFSDGQMYNNLGMAYYQDFDFSKAAVSWQKALRLAPYDAGVISNLARVYQQGG